MVEDFDLVLCDMVMPTFPGDKFYLAVERVKPALCRRFLFMTGHRAETQYETFIQEIGGLMLWKPFWPHELLAAMQSVLRRADELDVAEWSKDLSIRADRNGERGRRARSFRRLAENTRAAHQRTISTHAEPVGGTPTGATGTLALPVGNILFPLAAGAD